MLNNHYAAMMVVHQAVQSRKNISTNLDARMASYMMIHMAVNNGPTEQDGKGAKKLGRVPATLYRIFGGSEATKIYKSIGFKIFFIMNSEPEEAITLLTDESSIIAGAAAAALS